MNEIRNETFSNSVDKLLNKIDLLFDSKINFNFPSVCEKFCGSSTKTEIVNEIEVKKKTNNAQYDT